MAAPLNIGAPGSGIKKPLPTSPANSGVAGPASSAAFASLNIGADQARGLSDIAKVGASGSGGTSGTGTTGTVGTGTTTGTTGTGTTPYSPSTDLTAGQSANYNDWFANNDETGKQIQNLAQQQAAQGNRKAAYLASMSGGNGGFYQSGQIAAGIRGQQAMQEGLLSNAQARGQIYGNKAAALGSLGIGAQQYGNALGLQHDTQDFTKEQAAGGAGQSAFASVVSNLSQRFKDGHPDWGPGTDAYNDFEDKQNAVTLALGNYQKNNPTGGDPMSDPAVAAALAELQNFDVSQYGAGGGKTSGGYRDVATDRLNTLRGI